MSIVILNYDCGNLASVTNIVNYIGYSSIVSNKKEDIESCDKIILPGVGLFGHGCPLGLNARYAEWFGKAPGFSGDHLPSPGRSSEVIKRMLGRSAMELIRP